MKAKDSQNKILIKEEEELKKSHNLIILELDAMKKHKQKQHDLVNLCVLCVTLAVIMQCS